MGKPLPSKCCCKNCLNDILKRSYEHSKHVICKDQINNTLKEILDQTKIDHIIIKEILKKVCADSSQGDVKTLEAIFKKIYNILDTPEN